MDKIQNENQIDIEAGTIPVDSCDLPTLISTCNNHSFKNIEKLTPELFFDQSEIDIIKSYFNVSQLKLKLLEYLEEHRKNKNKERKKIGRKFYKNNIGELKIFSEYTLNTQSGINNIHYRGEILIWRFYPEIVDQIGKYDIIRSFHSNVRSAFEG